MNRKRIERALGRFLFVFASKLPESTSPVNFGAKRFRALCGRLIMKSCERMSILKKEPFLHQIHVWEINQELEHSA